LDTSDISLVMEKPPIAKREEEVVIKDKLKELKNIM
jgi:hypothetical protein